MEPCWILLMLAAKGRLMLAIALGPVFSSQVKSIIWLAMVCPNERLILGKSRWKMVGKNPSIFEKWCGAIWGVGLSCLDESDDSSRAMRRPVKVTNMAPNLAVIGMVITGILLGRKLEVRRRPATMLPHASRFSGLITAGLFSLIGERELNRGWPMDT